jgi:Ser/Thr protein kinase RdoA (MazF antagonist)
MKSTDVAADRFPVIRSFLDPEALSRLIEAAHGLSGVRCRLIKGTIRDIYLVTSATGPFVLAVYRHGLRTTDEIRAELALLEHLDAAGAPVAPAVPRPGGDRLLPISAPEGDRYAVLFRFVDGSQLSKTPEPETVRRFGRAVALVHRLSDGVPGALARPRLDAEELIDRSLAAFAAAAGHRTDVVAYLHDLAPMLRRRLADLPTVPPAFGLIHGDVIPSNAQIEPSGDVVVLDFDFCGYGWRAYDVATYLNEVAFWTSPADAAEAFLAGYQAVRPLAAREVTALPLLEAVRGIASLGVPAANAEVWGSAYLSDRMIDAIVATVRGAVARMG